MSHDDPGFHLSIHQAPKDLLTDAVRRASTPATKKSTSVYWAAAAALLIGAGGGWLGHKAFTPAPTVSSAPSLLVATSNQPVSVRLVLHAPTAGQVQVAGTFNDWTPQAAPLRQGTDGTWHTTLQLPRGRHEYMFVIDGDQWVSDPTADLSGPDDFGQTNTILDV